MILESNDSKTDYESEPANIDANRCNVHKEKQKATEVSTAKYMIVLKQDMT